MKKFGIVAFILSLAGAMLLQVRAAAADPADIPEIKEFARMRLEELLQQDVTSVMRKSQLQSKAPSALYVLSSNDIRRSGATSIVEALRLVPGVNVSRNNSNSWTVTARGYDVKGGTKLLVLIDGRSVYSPFFSGVFWDIQDTNLEDIDRIEVIRGPGAVTWGENAVNGVINIITKKAIDTQGLMTRAVMGDEERAILSARYGGKAGADTAYRVYGKFLERDSSRLSSGGDAQDGWEATRGGFRSDTNLDPARKLTLQGDLYNEHSGNLSPQFTSYMPPFEPIVRNETESHGGNLLSRYTEDFSETSHLSVQAYYDRTSKRDFVSAESRHTFDLDVQHHVLLSERHDVVYGLDYRFSRDHMGESFSVDWSPPDRETNLVTAFFQDEIALIPGTLSLIPGTKIGYNDLSGVEYQPAIKALYSPAEEHAVWASISRAVRIPSRFDEDVRFSGAVTAGPDGTPIVPTIFGNKGFQSEKVFAYELGYRAEPVKDFSFDLALFYNHYDDLISVEPGAPYLEGPPAHLTVPLNIDNRMHGDTYGGELAATWRAAQYLTFAATYSYIQVAYARDAGSMDTFGVASEGRTPHHGATGRAHLDLPFDLEFDAILYYVDSASEANIPGYVRTDARLGWTFDERLTLDVVGQNLFDPSHREGDLGFEIQRAVYGRVTYLVK